MLRLSVAGWILLREGVRNSIHLRLRLCLIDPFFQARDDHQVITSALLFTFGEHRRRPEFGAPRKPEALRRDADDRVSGPAQRHNSSDHVRVSVEAPLPQTVAEHGDAATATVLVFR